MNGPERLFESEGGRLARALKQARAQLPGDARLADIAAGLARQGAPIDPSTASAAGNAGQASFSLAAKIGLGIGGVVALAALALLLRARPTPQVDPARAQSGTETGALASSTPAASVAGAAPLLAPGSRPTPLASTSSEATGAEPDARAPALLGSESRAASASPVAAEPALSPTPPGVSGGRAPGPEIDAARPRASSALSQGALAAPGTLRGNADPAQADDEVTVLKEARAALATNPSQALALTERHRSEFPRGSLAQEREIIAITALTRLGQTASAHERANRFRNAYPRSAYLKQLERVLGRE